LVTTRLKKPGLKSTQFHIIALDIGRERSRGCIFADVEIAGHDDGAKRLVDGHDVELWSGARLVRHEATA